MNIKKYMPYAGGVLVMVLLVAGSSVLSHATRRPLTQQRGRPQEALSRAGVTEYSGIFIPIHGDPGPNDENKEETHGGLLLTSTGEQLQTTAIESLADGHKYAVQFLGTKSKSGLVTVVKLESSKPAPGTPIDQPLFKKILVIPIYGYGDTTPPAYTPDQIKEKFETGTIHDFYTKNSYGKVKLSAFVTDWISTTTPFCIANSPNDLSLYDPLSIPEVVDYINQHGIHLSNYSIIMPIYFPCIGRSVGIKEVVYNFNSETYMLGTAYIDVAENNAGFMDNYYMNNLYSWFDLVSEHELGHVFGLFHSHGFDCGTEVYSNNCTSTGGTGYIEYGDPYDAMGLLWNNAGLNFNAYYRHLLGWLMEPWVQTVKESGTYQLAPLDRPQTDAVVPNLLLVQPPGYTTPVYALEYRTGDNYDSYMKIASPQNVGKVLLQIISGSISPTIMLGNGSDAYRIDVHPTSAAWNPDTTTDVAGLAKYPWHDAVTGTTFSAHQNSLGMQDVSINFDPLPNPCVRADPTITLNPSSASFAINDFDHYSQYPVISVHNNDTYACGDSRTFTISNTLLNPPATPPGWSSQPTSITVHAATTGVVGTSGYNFNENAPAGSYTVQYVAKDAQYNSNATANQIITITP